MLSSQLEASTSDKVEGISVIFSSINNNIPKISAVISLQSSKLLDELVSKRNTKEKQGDDSAQQSHNKDLKETTSSTYKLTVPLSQCFKNININAFYTDILEISNKYKSISLC